MGQIAEFINKVPYISEQQKNFYQRYIQARLELILRPAFDIAVMAKAE